MRTGPTLLVKERLLYVPREGKLKEEYDRRHRIAEEYGLDILLVYAGVDAGLSDEEIVRIIREGRKLEKDDFEIRLKVKNRRYPTQADIEKADREYEERMEEHRLRPHSVIDEPFAGD